MVAVATVLPDLHAESADLDAIVSGLAEADWALPTPALGWTIADQVGHLNWTDDVATLATTDPVAFGQAMQRYVARREPFDVLLDHLAEERAAMGSDRLLQAWRVGREVLETALKGVPEGSTMPWFGPPMSAASMASARLLETWAHGQDIADALGIRREATARLRHVAHIGVRTRDFAFVTHELPAPSEEFRIELTAPDGTLWTWGPPDARQRVSGPALDFCLLVTRRRNRADLSLRAEGPEANTWLDIAQSYAGPPGPGRTPGQFG